MIDRAAVLNPPVTDDNAPRFAKLGRFRECEEIIARNNVGRMAFALEDRVSIVPIHYVYAGGWIYGRTAAGGKLREILRNRRIAFEVDEHKSLFEWQSVVARGPLYLIEPGVSPSDQRVYARAVSLIRGLIPTALTESDPIPFRDQLFRIRVVEISGRTSEPTGGEKRFPVAGTVTADAGEADSDAVLCELAQSAVARIRLSSRSNVHVDAFDGLIVLTGLAEDAAEKSAIEAELLGIPEARVIVQQLETLFPSQQQLTPSEIAREARRQLALVPPINDPGIKIVSEHGWLRLEGVAKSMTTREEVLRRLRTIKGSRGVIDKLHSTAPPTGK
jgi:nitroimidazol reductase NimA-like FMN-containing flavoprotein (pyridoxamine 5'-phosphate oxidase superfamily)